MKNFRYKFDADKVADAIIKHESEEAEKRRQFAETIRQLSDSRLMKKAVDDFNQIVGGEK